MNNLHRITALPLLIVLGLASAGAVAHPMTEKYIPVGAYPNWERGTVRGTLESVDRADKSIVVRTASGLIRTQLGDSTNVWLDRSAQGKTTLDGRLSDLRAGQEVEVRRIGDYGPWVKVKVEP